MSFKEKERRSHHRYILNRAISYKLSVKTSNPEGTTFRGISVNVSYSGLCLYVAQPLFEGYRLQILSGIIREPHQTAKVRWARQVHSELYKVGLKFEKL